LLSVYIESYEPDPARQDADPKHLKTLIELSRQIAAVKSLTGRTAPPVIT
jgi:hypothetical protein